MDKWQCFMCEHMFSVLVHAAAFVLRFLARALAATPMECALALAAVVGVGERTSAQPVEAVQPPE